MPKARATLQPPVRAFLGEALSISTQVPVGAPTFKPRDPCFFGFEWMVDIIPEGRVGGAQVVHFEVSEQASFFHGLSRNPSWMQVRPGRFAKLIVDGGLVMSDTHMERWTNHDALHHTHGHVLIGGLGLAMLPRAMMIRNPRVTRVTIVERSADVIELIGPYLEEYRGRVEVVHADVFDYKPARGTRFNAMWMDIWSDISTDNLPEMAALSRRFSPYMDRAHPSGYFFGHWTQGYLKVLRRQNQREDSRYYF